jgi:5-methylcytosine-specific restriction endonuclease McrA
VTAAVVRGLHPVLGRPLPPLTEPAAPERRDWSWPGNARRRLRLTGLVIRVKGTRCHLCGGPGATTADHLVPWSHGGPNTLDNLEPAHHGCNSARGNRPLAVWFAAHPVRVPALAPSRDW